METKICSKCNETLSIEEFSFRNQYKNHRRAECKKCFAVLTRKHYVGNKGKYYTSTIARRNRNKEYIKTLLQSKSCTDCNNSDWRVLEFDHLSDKIKGIAYMIVNAGLKTLLKEIEKCEVVCANCHKIRTYSRQDNCYRNA